MKLSKIYSNKDCFKPIVFNTGFNIIYGDVDKKIDEKTGKVYEHNIGKTSLIHLIDFLLLKKISKKDILIKNKNKFSDWVFYLEIELNNGNFLTIKRPITNNTKISFKEHFKRNQDYTHELVWNYKDLSIGTLDKTNNPKDIFQKYLNFDVNSNYNYRHFLSYSLRTQNDYQDVFRLNKFRGKDINWKPALFGLLGFKPELLYKKYELEDQISEDNSFIRKITKNNDSDKEIYKIKAAIEAKEIEKKEIESKIDSFDFYKKERGISYTLVKEIESNISMFNKEEYKLKYELEQIRNSLDSNHKPSLKIEEVETLFKEVKIYFPQNLVKGYGDVTNFLSQITEEREKYLKDELKETQEKYENVLKELEKLNQKRKESILVLEEKDTFVKYKKYQNDLITIENEIYSYKKRLDDVNSLGVYKDAIDESENEIKELTKTIKEELDKSNPEFQNIKKIFQSIYKKTFEYTALLVLEPNSRGNIDFTTTVLNQNEDLTGQADGYTSTKVLCASFVLAILINYSTKSFFRFAYHDGILESWGDNHKIQFIELVREYCKKNNIQYIISIIKSDIPKDFNINQGEIVRTISKDNRLFGFEF